MPQKHKGASRVKYNSGFYIATNNYPDFGNEKDNGAIKSRLETLYTKSLTKTDPRICREYFS